MKKKILQKFWSLLPLFILISLIMTVPFIPNRFISFMPINKLIDGQKLMLSHKAYFYHYSIAYLIFTTWLFFILKTFSEIMINHLSEEAKNKLSFTDYFELKKSLNQLLSQKDIDYVKEKVEEKEFPAFLKKYQQNIIANFNNQVFLRRITPLELVILLITFLNIFSFFIFRLTYFVPSYMQKSVWPFPPLLVSRGIFALICAISLSWIMLKRFLVIFLFAQKVDSSTKKNKGELLPKS